MDGAGARAPSIAVDRSGRRRRVEPHLRVVRIPVPGAGLPAAAGDASIGQDRARATSSIGIHPD